MRGEPNKKESYKDESGFDTIFLLYGFCPHKMSAKRESIWYHFSAFEIVQPGGELPTLYQFSVGGGPDHILHVMPTK